MMTTTLPESEYKTKGDICDTDIDDISYDHRSNVSHLPFAASHPINSEFCFFQKLDQLM